jgi:TonB family protein
VSFPTEETRPAGVPLENGVLKPYLLASSSLHAALLAGALLMLKTGGLHRQPDVYRIDFISPAAGVTPLTAGRQAAPAAVEAAKPTAPAPAPRAAAKRAPPPPAPNEVPRRSKTRTPLMRPSVLSEPQSAPAAPRPAPAPAPAASAPAAAPSSALPGADVTADFPNFPYPWYITQLRTALWNQWTQVMPNGGSLGCVVRFAIDRSGQPSSVEVEQSSGNSLYDYAALSAVRGAAPFPPLPEQFREGTLKVHVQFRTAAQ